MTLRAASLALAALMAVQAALGLRLPGAYRDASRIEAVWYGNDWVTLVVAVPLLVAAIVRVRRGSTRAGLLWYGVLGYVVYNYAYYLLGATLNVFFPLYVAALVSAAITLILALRQLDPESNAIQVKDELPVRILGGYLLFVALGLGGAWFAMWGRHIFAGAPTPVALEVFRLVAALDLTLMVPALAVGGVLLWRRRPWGIVIASIAGVQAALYLLVLSVNSVVAITRGFAQAPGELPVWGALALLTGGAAAALLAGVHAVETSGDETTPADVRG